MKPETDPWLGAPFTSPWYKRVWIWALLLAEYNALSNSGASWCVAGAVFYFPGDDDEFSLLFLLCSSSFFLCCVDDDLMSRFFGWIARREWETEKRRDESWKLNEFMIFTGSAHKRRNNIMIMTSTIHISTHNFKLLWSIFSRLSLHLSPSRFPKKKYSAGINFSTWWKSCFQKKSMHLSVH